MLKGRHFKFRPVLTIFILLAMAALVSLGNWQMRRLEWKRDLVAKVEARLGAGPIAFDEAVRRAEAGEDMEYTPVTAAGVLEDDKHVRVFGSNQGRPGAFYFAPLRRNGAPDLFVNLGFAPQDVAPALEAGDVTGLFRYPEIPGPPSSWFVSAAPDANGFWILRDPALFAADQGVEASSYYIDQFAVPGRPWPKGGTTRLEFNNRHLEYALTWYGLALTLLGVALAFSLQRRPLPSA